RGPVALRGRQGLPRRGRGEPHRRRDRRRGGHPRPHPRDPLPHHPRRPRGRRPREPRGGRAGEVRREAHREPPARSGGRPMNAPHPGPVPLDPVEDAIAAIAAGRAVVVVDDEDRENEGDLILAASAATPELIGFAVRHSSGLLCAPMGAERADALELPLMVRENADPLRTAYTVSVDASAGVTTGISAADRARTLRVLAGEDTVPEEPIRPGHG